MRKNKGNNSGMKGKMTEKVRKPQVNEHNKPKNILTFFVKLLVVIIVSIIVIFYSDKKGIFNSDMRNNHTLKKWDAFYEFSKRNNIDILLMGNSHLYTGINPKNLSITLNCNAFILASPGTKISDTYWGLKEAIKKSNPSVVVIETYGIEDFDQRSLNGGDLSDQFKSFSARKDVSTKLQSLPYLFEPNNYILALSNTLRNHNFIFDNYEQIKRNKVLNEQNNRKRSSKEDLYLGRYVRFTSGLQDSLIQLYRDKGSPVDGGEYNYSGDAAYYIGKIIDLCTENDIQLVFLTLPMYEEHISNYETWQSKLNELLTRSGKSKWLNMQEESVYNSTGFSKNSFENTYKPNQHMTYSGSLLATYCLADFLKNDKDLKLPDRSSDTKWQNIFYAQEGYFEHFSPREGDSKRTVLLKAKQFKNIEIKELLLLENEKYNSILVKVSKEGDVTNNKGRKIRILIDYSEKDVRKRSYIDLSLDKFHLPGDFLIYSQNIRPSINIEDVLDAAMM